MSTKARRHSAGLRQDCGKRGELRSIAREDLDVHALELGLVFGGKWPRPLALRSLYASLRLCACSVPLPLTSFGKRPKERMSCINCAMEALAS